MRDTVERRLSIVAALCKRHSDTIGNLAAEYGVSESLAFIFVSRIYAAGERRRSIYGRRVYLGKRISDAGTGKFACEIKPDFERTGCKDHRDYPPRIRATAE